jgi:hypothetical protein
MPAGGLWPFRVNGNLSDLSALPERRNQEGRAFRTLAPRVRGVVSQPEPTSFPA